MEASSNLSIHQLCQLYRTLTIFWELQTDRVFYAFCQFLKCADDGLKSAGSAYRDFAAALYQEGMTDDWTEYLQSIVLAYENPCIVLAAQEKEIPACMEEALRNDLRVLSVYAAVTPEQLAESWKTDRLYVPKWRSHAMDLETLYFERLANIRKYGYGIYAKYRMFHMELSEKTENGFILSPVACPDAVGLSDLIGYTGQRSQVIENTRTLLRGQIASNILLYGDAGTGKSATVKAVANAFAEEGLRLVELSKNELHLLPKLLEELSENPLKFILFIDDLSFQENDDDFSALKAVLEGSISARSRNTVIYATSNRRHIVRETFSQRVGDEVHRNDTMQETISLSERFGIQLLFDKPNKALYLEIVSALAQQYGLQMDAEELALEAERFATRKCGRSARAARQLVEQLCAREQPE